MTIRFTSKNHYFFTYTSPPQRSSCTSVRVYPSKLNPYELSAVVVLTVGQYNDVKVMSKRNIYKTAYGIC